MELVTYNLLQLNVYFIYIYIYLFIWFRPQNNGGISRLAYP